MARRSLNAMNHWITRAIALTAGCLTLLAPVAAQADALWLQPHADGAQALAGTVAQPAPSLPLQASVQAASIQVPRPQGRGGAAVPDLRLQARHVDPQGVLTYYQAKLGRQDTKAQSDLELVPTTPGGNTFKLVWKGQTVPATRVNVDTSAGWSRTLTPAADGTVQLETPFAGLYVLEVSARINGSAMVDGTKYEEVRHTATLSFEVVR
jgi:hypothetical protein